MKLSPSEIRAIAVALADELEARRVANANHSRGRLPMGIGAPGHGDTECGSIPAPPRCERGGFVYFVRADAPGFPIKIGVTKDVEKRLSAIRSGCPYDARLIGFYWVHDPYQEEAGLHEKYAEHRLRGEWFESNHDLLEAIAFVRIAKAMHVPHGGVGVSGALDRLMEDE